MSRLLFFGPVLKWSRSETIESYEAGRFSRRQKLFGATTAMFFEAIGIGTWSFAELLGGSGGELLEVAEKWMFV